MSDNPFALSNIQQDSEGGTTPAGSNPFALSAIQSDQRQDQRVLLRQAIATNPDEAAKAAKLAKQYPVSEDVLARNLRDVEMQAAVDKADEQLQTSPRLAQYLRDKPFTAKQAHDDIGTLAQIEQFFRDTGGSAKAGVLNANRGAAGVFQAAAELVAPVLDPLEGVTAVGGNPLRRLAEGFAMLGQASGDAAKAAAPKTEGNISSGFQSGIQSFTQNTLMLPMAFLPGGQSAALAGMVSLTGGQSYQDAREKGLPMSQALPFAASQAAIEYATEKLPLGQLIGDVKAGTPIFQMLAKQIALEVPGEQIATILQDLNEWAVLNPTKPFADYIAERPNAAAQTLVATIVGTGGNVAVTKGIDAVIRRSTQSAGDTQNANVGADRLKQQLAAASQALLRERNPDEFRSLVQHMADNTEGAPKEVFVDAEVLNQLAPELLAQLPESVRAALPDALAANDAVAIPVGDVLTLAPGTPLEAMLVENARLNGPESMSQAEAKQASAQAQEFLAMESQRVIQQAVDQQATQESHDRVKQTLLERLNTIGRDSPAVNTTTATLYASMYTTLAGQLGITPEAAFQLYGVNLVGKTGQGAVLNAGTKTGELAVEGYHFSKADRPVISTAMFGTGLQGSGKDTYLNAADQRLRKRAYFYVDKGTGINPEAGVGGRGQRANLTNIYDSNADPLRLKTGRDQLGFESAVLDVGFSGYLDRLDGTQSGQVILLGDQNVRTEVLGPLAATRGQVVPTPQRTEAQGRDAIVEALNADKALPSGAPTIARWQELLAKNPTVLQALTDAGVFAGDQNQSRYKSDLIKQFIAATEAPVYEQSVSLRNGKETLKKFGLTPGKKYKTREVAAALESRQRAKYGQIAADDRSPEAAKKIAGWMAEEIQFEMEQPGASGVGWYSEKFQRALDQMAVAFPELATDKQARDIMTALIAITSDGQKVHGNFTQAADIYGNFRDTGKFTTDRGHQRQASITGNLENLQRLLELHGPKKLHTYLLQEKTIGDLKKIAATKGIELSSDYQVSVKMPMAVVEFGPKLGAFYANLMGAHGYLTMDRWWSRSFNRYRGILLDAPTRQGLDRFKALMGDPAMSDDAVLSAVVGPHDSYAAKGFKDGTEIEKAANTIYKAAFTELNDAPFNATDRSFILDSVNRAQKLLARRGVKLTVADIQAALWYYEKRLYGELGARQTADTSYEDAAKRVVAERASGLERSDVQAVEPGLDAFQDGSEGSVYEQREQGGANVVFEVAPDPNDAELTATWRELNTGDRLAISDSVARQVVPKVLEILQAAGDTLPQTGSYVDDTNPSFALRLQSGDPLTAARVLGYVLAQDSMVVASTEPFDGGSETGAISISVGDKSAAEIDAIYQTLREIRVGDEQPIGGQSTVDGEMVVLNFSNVPNDQLAQLIDDALSNSYSVETRAVYAAFPEKQEYDYASEENVGREGEEALRDWARDARAEATQLLREALDARRAAQTDGTYAQGLAQRGAESFETTYADKQGETYTIRLEQEVLGRGADRALTVRVNAYQGDQRRARVDFDVQGNTLAAENTITAPAYRGRGLAEALYSAAREAGYDIMPGRKQTADGEAMVARLRAKGLINAERPLEQTDTDADSAGEAYAQDGVSRPLLAPNGKPSNLTPAQHAMVRTPEFKTWFGDWENDPSNASKVVDENGEPKVYYHGSKKAGFTEFNTDGEGKTEGTGAFFADSFQMAKGYSGSRDGAPFFTPEQLFADPSLADGLEIEEGVLVEVTVGSRGDMAWQWYADEDAAREDMELEEGEELGAKPGYQALLPDGGEATGTREEILAALEDVRTEAPGVYEVFLNVRDVVEIDWQGKNWDEGPEEQIWNILDEDGEIYDTAYSKEDAEATVAGNPDLTIEEDSQASYHSTDDAARQGRDMGADGVLITDVFDTGPAGYAENGNVLIVYRPENIKEVRNQGTFNPNDPNILKQGPRGTFNPKTFELALNENSNMSTVHHEMGHAYLEIITKIASEPNAPQAIVDQVERFLKWRGITGDETVGGTDSAAPLAQREPGTWYHGTTSDVDKFNRVDGGNMWGPGYYLTDNPDTASGYAMGTAGNRTAPAGNAGPNVMPVRVAEGGLFDMAAPLTAATLKKVEKALGQKLKDFTWPGMKNRDLRQTLFTQFTDQAGANAILQKAGFKGLVESSPTAGPGKTLMVFDAKNIKSDITGGTLAQGDQPTAPAAPITPKRTALETWNAMTLDQKRPHHEALAENYEHYLLTGKAPSLELQPLFRKLKAYMLNAYKTLKAFFAANPDVTQKLPPEMVQFYDRMLASEEQIAHAEEVAGLLPDEDATAEAVEKLTARSLRDLKWTVNARNKAIKALQKEAATLRKAVEAEVTAEVEAQPVYAARKFLRTDTKLTIAALEEAYSGEGDRYALLDWKPLVDQKLAGKEGAHPDIVADMFGFKTGDELVRALLEAEPLASVVEGMTDQRMLERHGDLIDQRAIEEAANEAVHNEARARSLATELRAQAEALNPRADTGNVNTKGSKITVNALAEAAKQFAENVVAKTPLKDLKAKAWQHTAAERRAGKRWQEATAKGETQEAVKAKQDQLLNNAAAKAALEAQGEMRKALEFFKRVVKDGNEKTVTKGRDPDVVNAARAILGAYGVAPRTAKTAAEYMELVAKNDPAMHAALQPSTQAALNAAQPLESLTMDELRALHEEIQAMWHLAKRSRQMEIDGNLLDLDDAADDLQGRMQEIGVPDSMPGDTRAITPAEKRARWLQHAGSLLRRTEQWAEGMDGKYGGPFLRLVFQPVKLAADRYRADRVKYRKAYQALVDTVAPALRKGPIAAPEIGYTFGEGHNGIGHAELLHAILHTGNESNKRKLLLGRGWATENADGTLDTTNWDSFVQRMQSEGALTKAHYDFAQGVWDLLEQTKPLAQKTHRDVFGRYFAEVTADEVVTPFGTYRGGYVPAQADPELVQDADLRKLAELENENMSYSFPATGKGFTKGRVEYNRPLLLNLRTIGQHLDKVLLFSHMEPAVRDVNKLLSQKGVSYSLGRIDPTIYAGMLTPWLKRSARQIVETPILGDGGISRALSTARSRAGMALMFANVSNTLQQITGFSTAFAKLKADGLESHMMRATAQYISNPKEMGRSVAAASQFMENRMENEIAAINDAMDEILLDASLYEKSQAWTRKHAYFMQTAMANTMEPIIWTAGYNGALQKGMSETDAVRYADGLVRQTQGSTLPEDVSRIETGPAYARVFTQFIGYFNMMANTNATALKQIAGGVGLKKGAGKALLLVTAGMLIPLWVAEAIAQAMRGGPDDEDDDGYLDDWLAAVLGMGTIKGAFAMVPFVGQLANAGLNRFNNNPADDKVSLSPAVSLLEGSAGVGVLAYKAVTDPDKINARNAVRDVASAISITTGLPAYAIARPLGYLAGVEQGKIEPTSAADAVRGAITGSASPESK